MVLHPQPKAQMAPKSFNHSTEMKSVQPFQVKKLTQKMLNLNKHIITQITLNLQANSRSDHIHEHITVHNCLSYTKYHEEYICLSSLSASRQ